MYLEEAEQIAHELQQEGLSSSHAAMGMGLLLPPGADYEAAKRGADVWDVRGTSNGRFFVLTDFEIEVEEVEVGIYRSEEDFIDAGVELNYEVWEYRPGGESLSDCIRRLSGEKVTK